MSLSCEIVRDLLVLYEDGACSRDSRAAVEAHLAQCPKCRGYLQALELPEQWEPPAEPAREERTIKKSFRKVRRRWALSLIAVLLIFPLIGLGVMGVNEYRGEGLCFTNLDEIWTARRFVKLLEKGEVEKAAGLLDFESDYKEIQEALKADLSFYMTAWQNSLQEYDLNGQKWVGKADFAQHFSAGSYNAQEAAELWAYVIHNQVQLVLIPEAAWETVVGGSATVQTDVGGHETYWLPDATEAYCRLETDWGTFLLRQSMAEDLASLGELTAQTLFQMADFMPGAVYADAQEALTRQAKADYQWNQDYYSEVADMSQEEFTARMRERFVTAMEECFARGISISHVSYRFAYRMEKQWCVEISADLSVEDGARSSVALAFQGTGGKLNPKGGHYITESEEIDCLIAAVNIRYAPEEPDN